MRVISGRLGGRVFASPRGHRTHPMSEKARGAIFNVLDDIAGLTVLDAYAGSGALGIEALSRGARRVVAIDSDKNAARTMRVNAKELGLANGVKIIQQNVATWSAEHASETYDIVFADPPYDHLTIRHIVLLCEHVALDGLLVLSWPGGQMPPDLDDVTVAAHKLLGDIQLLFYRRKQPLLKSKMMKMQ